MIGQFTCGMSIFVTSFYLLSGEEIVYKDHETKPNSISKLII
jgi:hypothetical protein